MDILWHDFPSASKSCGKRGELFLKVYMSTTSAKTKLWNTLVNNCLQIMDMVDWMRSHPDKINDSCLAYGIAAGWKYFLDVGFFFPCS